PLSPNEIEIDFLRRPLLHTQLSQLLEPLSPNEIEIDFLRTLLLPLFFLEAVIFLFLISDGSIISISVISIFILSTIFHNSS
ncbi:TPA: hypothetical protein DEG21_02620, partial [Patescibacteria group bacterium]|nr:hypothetical protein [Candidatus Gracilibacteria bacterium]